MSLFARKRRDGAPVLAPPPKAPPVWSDAEWHARVAAASRPAPPVPAGPVHPLRTFRACSDGHETVSWYGIPGCWFCGDAA